MAESTNWIATLAAAIIGLLGGYATKVLDIRSSSQNKAIDHEGNLAKLLSEKTSGYEKSLAEQVLLLMKQLEEAERECNRRIDALAVAADASERELNTIIRQLHQTNAEQQAEINWMKRHIDNLEKRIGST